MPLQTSRFWRTPLLRDPVYIDRYCETVHKRHLQRHAAVPSLHVPEESRNALRFAHGRRGHRRTRLR